MRKLVILLALIAGLLPATASAQTADSAGTRIEIDHDAVVPAGETLNTLIVINGDATIEGMVEENVLVIGGDATVNGTIQGTVTVIDGDVILMEGANVEDIRYIEGDVDQAPGATVGGDIEELDPTGFWAALGVFSVLLWVGLTVALLVAGVFFALIAPRQLNGASAVMTGDAVASIIGVVVLWIAVPIAAGIAIVTIIGMPLGVGVLAFLLPAMGFLGYLVAATRFGTFLLRALKQRESERPIVAVILGVILFQLLLFVPFLGFLLVFLASIWGAGALAAVAFRSARGESALPSATPPPLPTEH